MAGLMSIITNSGVILSRGVILKYRIIHEVC